MPELVELARHNRGALALSILSEICISKILWRIEDAIGYIFQFYLRYALRRGARLRRRL